MSDTILVERDGAIATVVLNRPRKLNALTKPMWRRLGEVMTGLSQDDDLRCVVLRGAGASPRARRWARAGTSDSCAEPPSHCFSPLRDWKE